MINRFYVGATKAIAEEDSLVEKLPGDAVAAFWGAGFAGKDYVARTIRAAQTIARERKSQNIPVGIGVHAGAAFWSRRGGHAVTVAGVDSQNSLFAISDPDNDAAKLELLQALCTHHLA